MLEIQVEKLLDFKSSTGEPVINPLRYGSLVLTFFKRGAESYAKVYDFKTGKLVYWFDNNCITGKRKQIQSSVSSLAAKYDFAEFSTSKLSDTELDLIAKDVKQILSAYNVPC